jgi:hypothetical protein
MKAQAINRVMKVVTCAALVTILVVSANAQTHFVGATDDAQTGTCTPGKICEVNAQTIAQDKVYTCVKANGILDCGSLGRWPIRKALPKTTHVSHGLTPQQRFNKQLDKMDALRKTYEATDCNAPNFGQVADELRTEMVAFANLFPSLPTDGNLPRDETLAEGFMNIIAQDIIEKQTCVDKDPSFTNKFVDKFKE